mgnify:CR=1 FL=1
MNKLKKFLSLILALLMCASLNSASLIAYAQDMGTEDNPYQITTAQELQNINNDVTAHYKLMADIDLNNVEFTPIGNADSGAFSGVFDGNGHTISNLNVLAGKFAGLFGYNEGIIKNVTLKDIYVYGTRYLGGIVGQNTSLGTIADCKVLSGTIESDGGLNKINAGGICGFNSGSFEGAFLNGSNLTVESNRNSSQVGGIVGFNEYNFTLNALNTGNVFSSSHYSPPSSDAISYICSGGLIGYCTSSAVIINSYNTGNVSSTTSSDHNYAYLGGLIGLCSSSSSITNSYNTGNISSTSDDYAYLGGLIGGGSSLISNSYSTSVISNSYNTGNISSSYNNSIYLGEWFCSGGLIGICDSSVISNSYNTGNILSSGNCALYSGGLIGVCTSYARTTIANSYNTGNVSSDHSGGLIGNCIYSSVTITNCYNVGNVSKGDCIVDSEFNNDSSITDTYILKGPSENSYGISKSKSELSNKETYSEWDLSLWNFDSNQNDGFPTLKNACSPIQLNHSVLTLLIGETDKLIAYKNGVATENVTWSVTSGNAIGTDNGYLISAGTGASTVTATDSYGNKANCSVYALEPATALTTKNRTINISEGPFVSNYAYITISGGLGDYIASCKSSDDSVVSVEGDYGHLKINSVGTATITATTAGGTLETQKITVVNSAKSISLQSSVTIARGNEKQLTATTNPSPTSSKISWKSSDTDVATVDQNGNVTGVNIGSAIITATTDNGCSDTCEVTINASVTSMEFEKPSITVYKNDTQKLNLIYSPSDTTDTISYSRDNSGISVSSDGTITANYTGTYKITATASSGVKAYCTVKVIDYPVVVTSITIDQAEHDMLVGEVFKLNATVTPSNATNKTVEWASTDESVATVTSGGTVEAKGAGKTVITATTENGIVAYCVVNVTGVASTNLSKIYVPDVLATDKNYVDIPVMIENNPGISFAAISVLYDSDKLEPVSVNNGCVFDSVLGSIENSESKVKLYFTSDCDIYSNGVLVIIRFNVLDSKSAPPIKLCYFPSEIRNSHSESVSFNLSDGVIEMPKCKHANTEIRNAKPATCTQNGYTGDKYCRDCDILLEAGTVINAIGAHSWDNGRVTKPATCTATGVKTYACTVCRETKTETIAKIAHSYKTTTTKATTSKNGSIVTKCTVCGSVSKNTTIYYPKTVTLSATSYMYDGKVKKPSVTVKDSRGNKLAASNYTVTYSSGRKNVGTYTVTVSFKGNYSGTVKRNFTINPKPISISKITAKSKGFTVKWKKQVTQTTGYEIQYATDNKFSKNKKTVTVSSNKTTSKTISRLKPKKKYYVHIRTYKTVNGKKVYSSWSKIKTITTKK